MRIKAGERMSQQVVYTHVCMFLSVCMHGLFACVSVCACVCVCVSGQDQWNFPLGLYQLSASKRPSQIYLIPTEVFGQTDYVCLDHTVQKRVCDYDGLVCSCSAPCQKKCCPDLSSPRQEDDHLWQSPALCTIPHGDSNKAASHAYVPVTLHS